MTAPSPWIRMLNFHHADGGCGVVFRFERARFAVSLMADRRSVIWMYQPALGGETESAASGVAWRFGRLVSDGEGYPRFRAVLEELGLSCGQVESELRGMTNYEEGTE